MEALPLLAMALPGPANSELGTDSADVHRDMQTREGTKVGCSYNETKKIVCTECKHTVQVSIQQLVCDPLHTWIKTGQHVNSDVANGNMALLGYCD